VPKHYAINENVVKGTATFNNTRNATIYFKREDGSQVTFYPRPHISLTLMKTAAQPVANVGWIQDIDGNFIGSKIKFNTVQSLEVEWIVQE